MTNNDPFYKEPAYEREARLREQDAEKASNLRRVAKHILAARDTAHILGIEDFEISDDDRTLYEELTWLIEDLEGIAKQLERR